ncbi:MAG: CoA transferase, partial [Actinomycetota bacterium]
PTKVGSPYVDYSSGLLLAFAVLAGLRQRDLTDDAVQVDITMLDAALLLNLGALVRTANTGEDPPRTGNEAFSSALASGAFETADGLLAIAANKPSHHVRLCDLLGLGDLADRTDLTGPGADAAQVETARARIAEALLGATALEWEGRLAAARVPAAAVRRLSDVIGEGHPATRGLLQPVAGDDEDVLLPGSGVRINGHMAGPAAPAAACGADTDQVLTEAGFAPHELAELRADGLIG